MTGEVYRFEDFELATARFELRQDGEPVRVEPRALDVLAHLVSERERVVSKDELLDEVWGDRFVSEAAITTALRTARQAIDDSGREQRLVRTVHGRGYQFVGDVTVVAATDAHHDPDAATDVDRVLGREDQEIRFCRTPDDTTIAWATVGTGQPLLKAANWMTHLDLEWSSPVWAHWLRGLGRDRRLIRYDERGCGLSDWEIPEFSFEAWVDDLEVVVDAVGIERFPLLGVSQGGAVAIAYAVRHPERVSRLVLAGAYARGRAIRAQTQAQRDVAALDLELARVGWAREDPSFLQVFASQFLPDGTPDEWADFTVFQRQTTSPANGVRFLEEFARIDVSDLLDQVRCPTLILHARDDVRVPATQARELAAGIDDSHLVLLDSTNHLLTASEPAWPEFLAHINDFLADD